MTTITATSQATQTNAGSFDFGEIAGEFGGDVNSRVAAMMLHHARDVRESAQTARAAEEENLRRQEDAQIRSMHEQADRIRSAGIASGTALIAGGAFQFAGGMVALNGPTLASGDLAPTAKGTQVALDGVGQAAQGTGKLVASHEERAGKIADSDSTAAGHRADAAKRRLDDLDEEAANARELARTAIDFLRDQTRTKGSADSAAVSIRG